MNLEGETEPFVLIVDDEPEVAMAFARRLRLFGLRVETCCSSIRALERFSAGERFDVVICDGKMPGLRGVELFQQARVGWPDLEQRIIFLSASLPEGEVNFIRRHTLLVLWKPLRNIDELVFAVRERAARKSFPAQAADE